jgi:hypothetical protein
MQVSSTSSNDTEDDLMHDAVATLMKSLVSLVSDYSRLKMSFLNDTGNPDGITIRFPNEMTVSVQWHRGSYSSVGRGLGGVPTFETAALYPDGTWFDPSTGKPYLADACDFVHAYQTADEVMATARIVAGHPVVKNK